MAITKKQKRFVEEYLIDLNATQAAIRAGYSVNTAQEQGYQLLQKTSVQQEIAKAMAERSRRTGINQDRVLLELAKIAFANIGDIMDYDKGKIKETATREDLASVESIKIKESDKGREIQVKIAKPRALELVGRHLGIFQDKVEVSGTAEELSKLDNLLLQLSEGTNNKSK